MKILAIASAGGHWIQLLRLRPAFVDHQVTYMSTKKGFEIFIDGAPYIEVPDSNRKDKLALLKSAIKIFGTIQKLRPQVVITTGAAPGIIALFFGRMFGAKTIWVDSVANVQELSMSGRIASKIASKVYTQWPDLAQDKIIYSGNILS